MNLFIVIADEFERFSNKPHLLRYSTLLHDLRRGAGASLRGRTFLAGQGLDEMEVDHAYCLALSEGLESEFTNWRIWRQVDAADVKLCHKSRRENVLISPPEQASSNLFVSELLIHARNELMLDHLTGEHIQGMVLTEACRQMFIAVTERYFLKDFLSESKYFVINEMAMRYLQFAFPLPGQLRYSIVDIEKNRPDRLAVQSRIEVWQTEKLVTTMDVKFAVYDARFLGVRESELACEAVLAHVQMVMDVAVPLSAGFPVRAGVVEKVQLERTEFTRGIAN